MGFALELSGLELEARELLGPVWEASWENEAWGWPERVLLKAFEADSFCARDRDSWWNLALVLESLSPPAEGASGIDWPKRVKLAFNRLVRSKAVRSYNEYGRRFYEVNFDDER